MKTFKFKGWVHPPTFKSLTSDKACRKVFIPKRVVMPLQQHVGSPAEPIVSVGEAVQAGSIIATASGFISSHIHASISGKVSKIGVTHTPTGSTAKAIYIESAGDLPKDEKRPPEQDPINLSKERLLEAIKNAGIVGLGGAAFPTHVKLSPPKGKQIDSVIVNGAECEPYLTCDHRIMLEKAPEILKGLEIVAKILGVKNCYIAIEDNKLSAVYAMEKALAEAKINRVKVEIAILKTKYPQGAEKQLIKSVLNRTVPAGGLPMDVSCVVHNVGTVVAIYEAVYFGKPLIERPITITGPCVKEPVNMYVRVGTLLNDLVESFGGFTKEPKKIIFGGPMMGIAQYTMDVPIVKGTSGILFLSDDELDKSKESVCVRCGKCVETCPMRLAPTTLMYRIKRERFNEAKELGVANCIECGACVYECPAKIPLLDYLKLGKNKA